MIKEKYLEQIENCFPNGRRLIKDLDNLVEANQDSRQFVHGIRGVATLVLGLSDPGLDYSQEEQQKLFTEGIQEAMSKRSPEEIRQFKDWVPYIFPEEEIGEDKS